MLSLSPISQSAGDAAAYYLNEEKQHNLPDVSLQVEPNKSNNYYLKEQSSQPNSQWFGKIAEREGLLGKPVEEKQLEEVLSGILNQRTVHGKRENHRSGFDLTFSAPKSVSTLILVGGDKRLMDAHIDAVKETLSQLEKDVAQLKSTGKDGQTEFVNSEKLLFALIGHKTSRNDDPQVHTHSLMANMTEDENGTLRALASCIKQKGGVINGTSERIYNHQKYYTALYQSSLSRKSVNLGYSIESIGHNQFEIEGVPKDYLESQSTRSKQINEHTHELGINSQAARDIAAKGTRKSKTYTSENVLIQKWQSDAHAHNFDIQAFVASSYKNARSLSDKPELKAAAIESLQRAIEHHSETKNQLSYEKLIESATSEFTRGEKLDLIDIKLAADQAIKDGQLLPVNESRSMFTTQTMIDNEKLLIASTQGQVRNLKTIVNDKSLEQLELSKDNQDKIVSVFESRKQTNVINVFGNSQQIARSLLHVGTDSGLRVHIITPDNYSKQQTAANVTRQAFTPLQWFKNIFRPEHTHSINNLVRDDTTPYSQRDLFVIEAANKLGVKDTQALIEKAQSSKSKLIFLNHANSKQGMKAGNVMETLKKGNVNEISWVDTKQKTAELYIYEKSDLDRNQAIADTLCNLSDKSTAQVLAATNKDVSELNSTIRQTLQRNGDVSRQGVTIKTLNPVFLTDAQRETVNHYKKGMVLSEWIIESGRNVKRDFIVTNINRKDNLLTISDSQGKEQFINPNERAVKQRNFSINQPGSIEISKGDQLRMNSNHFKTKLQQNQSLSVSSATSMMIILKDTKGERYIINPSNLENAPLSYDYARIFSKADNTKNHTIIGMKSYVASKELIHDLNHSDSKRIDIFTDSGEKLDKQLEKSDIRPSAIHRVMQATQNTEKFINHQTYDALLNDVNVTLSTLKNNSYDKGLIASAVQYAISKVSEKEAGFTQKDLITSAIEFAFEEKGQSITKDEIIKQLKLSENNGQSLSAEYHDGTRWTTATAIETEERIIDRLKAGKNTQVPLALPEHATQFLDTQTQLTDGQKDAIHLITTTKDRFIGIQGFPGTGKSTMLSTAIALTEFSQANNFNTKFIGLAPTHTAVNELREKGVESQTAQSLLSNYQSGNLDAGAFKNTVFLLDESSMTSNKQMDQFTELVEKTDARAVNIGDIYQLLSQEAGKPFELAIRYGHIDSVVMKDILRQKSAPTLLSAVHNVIDRQAESAIEKITNQSEFREYQSLGEPKNQQQAQLFKQAEHDQTFNIVSTLKETGNPAQDKVNAAESLSEAVALEYLARTPASRENTLIIAYTNQERDQISYRIRQGLQQQGCQGTENIMVPRLRSIGVEKTKMATMMPYKPGLILRTDKNNYASISHVDKDNKIVTIADLSTGKERPFYPLNHDHRFTQLWTRTEQPLSSQDKIMLRQTDKDRGWEGNKEYQVQSIDTQKVILSDSNGKRLSLSTNNIKDSHWDYAYTRTADMSQGATYNNVITSIKGKAILTNIRRGLIDISRASNHVKIFTDNPKNLIRSWINNETNKPSAIETRDKIYPEHQIFFNDKPSAADNPKYQDINGILNLRQMGQVINNELAAYTESLSVQLLGQYDQTKSNRDMLIFQGDKGNVQVNLTGQYRGQYRDWGTGEHGSLVTLMMNKENLSYKEALFKADKIIADPELFNLQANPIHDDLKNVTPYKQGQLEAKAIQYFNAGSSIKGTLAETYLSDVVTAKTIDESNLRFHNHVYSSETRKTYPAVLAPLLNSNNEIKGIEITYLNSETGGLAELDIQKRVLGTKSSNHIPIYEGTNADYSVIAVGIENALQVQDGNKDQVDIISVPTNNDCRTIDTELLRENVILILNQENTPINENLIDHITSRIERDGKTLSIIDSGDLNNSQRTLSEAIKSTIDSMAHQGEFNSRFYDALNDDIQITHGISTNNIGKGLIDSATDIIHNDKTLIQDMSSVTFDDKSIEKDTLHNTPSYDRGEKTR
ncbi:conjugative transfer relaxase/helicase TraI [Photobacterium sp. R1]